MTPAPFDTQKFVETLTASGLPEAQAKAISSAFREAAGTELATKTDLRELEQRMTIKLGSMLAVGIGIIATIVTLS